MYNRIFSLIAMLVLALSSLAATVETDRAWYLAGEAITVSVTDDNALIAYAELCDTHSLAAGVMISLRGGIGVGVIELPSNLHSGYYVLSVYTRHNADVSQQLVAVVNPLHKSADDNIEWVEITPSDSLSYQQSTTFDGQCSSTGEAARPSVMFNGQCSMVNDQWSMFNVRETEGHIIKARVKNVYNGHTFMASEIRPSMSIVGKQIHYFEGKMVNDSTAVFFTFGVHGKQPLVLSAMSSTGESLPVEMISPFAALLPKQLPHLVFHYKRSEVEARSLDMQRHQKVLHSSSEEEVKPLDYDDTVFGIKPDLSYNLDEYRQFLTIREVLLEYVMCVKNTTIDGVSRLIVRRAEETYNSLLPTLVLIDGMPVYDIERLLSYDARRIHYVNIYGGQYTFGNGIYNGILSFVTRSGRLTNYPTEPNVQYLVYEFPAGSASADF